MPPKEILENPVGWGPDSSTSSTKTATANRLDIGARGHAGISEDKFSFLLCNADKEPAKKRTFPEKQLVIAK